MNYVLIKDSELADILPLRCSYKTDLDLQLAIQSIGLASSGSTQTLFLNYDESLSSPNLENVITKFVEDIDFASLHLILNHPKLKTLIQPELLLGHYQIPSTTHVHKTLERSISWTPEVLNWLVLKKIKPHDLSFLNLLSAEECKILLESAAHGSLSKMDSLKLLEMISELILMKIDISSFNQSPWTEATLNEIKSVRYPMSFVYNPVKQIQLKWPKSVSTQTKRIQDKMGFQVQFFVSDPEELNQTLTQLEKMVPDWMTKLKGINS